MPDISDLMTINRIRRVPGSKFDSGYGIDESLLSSWQEELPSNISRPTMKRRLHPTVSELWVCDVGCGAQIVLPYVKGEEKLSSGKYLFFPVDVSGYRGEVLPRVFDLITLDDGVPDGINLKGKAQLKKIYADSLEVWGDSTMNGRLYITARFNPGYNYLSGLTLDFGAEYDPCLGSILKIDIRYSPKEGYTITGSVTANSRYPGRFNPTFIDCSFELGEDGSVSQTFKQDGRLPQEISNIRTYIGWLEEHKGLEGVYSPLLDGHKVVFYSIVKALVNLGINNRGKLSEVLRFNNGGSA